MTYVAQQTDIPLVRSVDASAQVPLAPTSPYVGCLALIPDADVAGQWNVALYVDATFPDGVTWAPPANTLVIDVPEGFSIQSANGILSWLQKTPPAGPGGDGTVAVTAVSVGDSPVPDPSPGSNPQPSDIPNVRNFGTSGVTPLAPLQGYQGCIAFFPDDTATNQLDFVLYVDSSLGQSDPTGNLVAGTGPGIPWDDSPDGAVVMDVPQGFCLNDGSAMLYWLTRAWSSGGLPPTTGGIGGETVK